MKIIALVLLVVALLGGVLMTIKCSNQAAENAKIEAIPMGGFLGKLADIPSSADFRIGMFVSMGLVLASVLGIVGALGRSRMLGLAGAGAVGLLSVLIMVLVPSMDGGGRTADPKLVAIVVGLIGVVGAAILGMVANKRVG